MDIKQIKECLIFEAYRGSITHGTYIPNSDPNSVDDVDTMGIFIPSLEYYLGLHHIEGKEVMEGKFDQVYYEIRKFFKLLLKGNPNVIGMLWLKPEHYILTSEWSDRLIENRNLFVSKQAFHSFAGYANGQLKRMTHFSFEGYMGEKRKKIVEKYGYDCKNASHLIRLLHMCIDYLKTGECIVYRPEREKLIEIKTGKWTLDKVKAEADELFSQAKQEFEKTTLPEEPNYEKVEKLLMDIIIDYRRIQNGLGRVL